MTSSCNLVHALALVIAIGPSAVAPSNAAQEFGRAQPHHNLNNLIDSPAGGDPSQSMDCQALVLNQRKNKSELEGFPVWSITNAGPAPIIIQTAGDPELQQQIAPSKTPNLFAGSARYTYTIGLAAPGAGATVQVCQLRKAAPPRPGAAQGNLFDAAGAGDLSRVKALLAANADLNARAANGATALMVASGFGHLEVVRALLAAKADVNAKTVSGLTASTIAEQKGHPEIVQLLKASLPQPDK